jgi:hypothetical protein
MSEPEVYSFPFHKLLTNNTRHLRDVDERSFSTGHDHLFDIVIGFEVILSGFTRPITGFIELIGNRRFQSLSNGHTRLRSHPIRFSLADKLLDSLFRFHHPLRYARHCCFIDNGVTDTN